MNEVKDRMKVLLLDQADKVDKLSAGSEEHHNCFGDVINLYKQINETEKIENDHEVQKERLELEDYKNTNDISAKSQELRLTKERDLVDKKKSHWEFIAKITVPAISTATMIGIAIIQAKGGIPNIKPFKPFSI